MPPQDERVVPPPPACAPSRYSGLHEPVDELIASLEPCQRSEERRT
jgi:hypothetical protein